jgi:hypothetical protein
VPLGLGVAQEHLYDALSTGDVPPADREVLRPLGLALGMSG